MKINTLKIEAAMAKDNLNFTQLAGLAGISRQTMSTINGRKTCKPEIGGKIARALGVSVEELIETEG